MLKYSGRGALTLAVEELHRNKCVKEIADTPHMQAKFRPEFCPCHPATTKFGEDVKLDCGEENLGRPEGAGRLQNWTGTSKSAFISMFLRLNFQLPIV